MSSRRPSTAHQEAVSRRLALLSAELSGLRAAEEPAPPPTDDRPPSTHTRISVARARGRSPTAPVRAPVPATPPEPLGAPPPSTLPPTLPQRPGRHAARRGRTVLLPEPLRGRIALGPGPLALVAVVVALGLAFTCWSVVRSDAVPVAAPVVGATPAATLATPAAGASPLDPAGSRASPAGEVTVDVTGRVRRPGIVVLASGARVVDAIEAAGGARPGVDLSTLNLARVLVDGEQVVVGPPAPGAAPGVPAPAVGTTGPATAPVNLNTAGQVELETLPDIGPVTAQAIIAWRTEHGGFRSVDELLEVDGIGDATLATLSPHVTV